MYAVYQSLVDVVESELGDYQSGFRPNRSTTDSIFMIRQIIEKCYEYNIDILTYLLTYSMVQNPSCS